jgi:hypothetical protein
VLAREGLLAGGELRVAVGADEEAGGRILSAQSNPIRLALLPSTLIGCIQLIV